MLTGLLSSLIVVLAMTTNAPAHLQLVDGHAVFPTRFRYQVELIEFFHGTVTPLTRHIGGNMTVVSKLDIE